MKLKDTFCMTLLDSLFDGVYFVDRDRKISYWNKGAERITGYTAAEVIGKHCHDGILMHVDAKGNVLCNVSCPLEISMCESREQSTQAFLHHKDGHRVPINVRIMPVVNKEGKVEGGIQIFSDNVLGEPAIERLNELERLAFLDDLTHLANRRYAEIALKTRLDEFERYGWGFGVLFVDIDNFKDVNDKYGHDLGDEVLKMVGKTLQNSVRSFDVVSRWGGEEYLIIIAHVDEEELLITANRCRMLVQQSSITTRPNLRITVSLGVTMARPDDTETTLFKRVDKLMYQSKLAGKNRVTMDS